ncbi:MAG: VanW family protein [Syntrophomonadaceae bacterium]|nr:VanW family protein [Syntrophomonadaceae bacterium]
MLRSKYKLIICTLLLVFTALFLYGFNYSNNLEILHIKESNYAKNIPEATNEASSSVIEVPWKNDKLFREKQQQHCAFVQMAAYKTVLQDSLPGEKNNFHLAARLLQGTVVEPGQVFSQNKAIGPYTYEKGFQDGTMYIGSQLIPRAGGGVCKMATTLYNVAVLCNLPIMERHSHSMPVTYVPYGQDATVSYGAKDLKFKNNTSFPILIWAQGIDNNLYVGFYGTNEPSRVEWHHKTLKEIKTYTIYRNNDNLTGGSEKVVNEGMDGAVVKSWICINASGGAKQIKQLGISYYNPMPCIIEKGTASIPANSEE